MRFLFSVCSRFSLVTAVVFLLFLSCNTDNNPADISASEAALASTLPDTAVLKNMEAAIESNEYPNIHSVLIAHKNKLVYEKYWPGDDQIWGDSLGVMKHAKDSLHDMRSVSKSVVSACIGIAVDQGKIKNVDQKIFDYLPAYAKYDTGMKSALTIKHLLTMTTGLKWNENIPYSNPENSERAMIDARDPIAYILSQPMIHKAGEKWEYNGGATQLLAAILENATGKKLDAFANEFLFKPLGISTFAWIPFPGTNIPAAASGLRLRSADILSFGLMYLNNGNWNNKQIVSASWVDESFQPHAKNDRAGSYGYQFWLWTDTVMNKPVPLAVAVGNGDQRVFINRADSLVVVITAGNYNKWDIEKGSARVLKDFVYPSVFGKR